MVSLVAVEGIVCLKNSDQKNYNIEMWRYSKLLKTPSKNLVMGHEHRANRKAKLQNVEIRLNSYGMRGPEPDLTGRTKKILFLGSSNTLGWGVPEDETVTQILQDKLGPNTVVMNAGIGNYNTRRYVELFKTKLRPIHPDIVVIHFFMNDTEILPPGRNNWLLRNSEVAAMLFHMIQESLRRYEKIEGLADYYRALYRDDSPGFQDMVKALSELDRMSKEDGFRVILAMTPDIHQMTPYPFMFAHEKMKEIAKSFGWSYVDLYGPLSAVPSKDLWAMPGDPHINGKGHRLMAEALAPELD